MKYYLRKLDWSGKSFEEARKILGLSHADLVSVTHYTEPFIKEAECTDANIAVKSALVNYYNSEFHRLRLHVHFHVEYVIFSKKA